MENNRWLLLLTLVVGAVLGGVINALLTGHAPAVFTNTVRLGVDPPMQLNLGVISLHLGVVFEMSFCSVLGILLAALLFRKL